MGIKKEKAIKRKNVEELIRKTLLRQGYTISNPNKEDDGADIIAENDEMSLYIETIGFKASSKAASRDFYEVFFRAFARLEEVNADNIVIAMPIQFLKNMKKRIESMKNAWVRLCIAFPEISVYFVDLKNEKIYEKKLHEILDTEEEI